MDESVATLSAIHLLHVSSTNTPWLVYSVWEQVYWTQHCTRLRSFRQRHGWVGENNKVTWATSAAPECKPQTICVCCSMPVKTTPNDAERWSDTAITSHREFLWVTRSESQSAENTASQKHVTNRFGLLITKEEVRINGVGNVRVMLAWVCWWEGRLSRLTR